MRRTLLIAGFVVAAAAVALGVFFATRERGYSAAIIGYRAADPQHLRIVYGQGHCDELVSAKADETATTVTVVIRVSAVSEGQGCGGQTADNREIEVALDQPLGSRSLQNDHGQSIPRLP